MPKDGTGERLLNAVKATETEQLAARTALAIERYQRSSSSSSVVIAEPAQIQVEESTGHFDQQPASLSGEVFWTRHEFGTNDLLIFSRGNGETLTIRKSPTGEGWIIIYDEPVGDCPE